MNFMKEVRPWVCVFLTEGADIDNRRPSYQEDLTQPQYEFQVGCSSELSL